MATTAADSSGRNDVRRLGVARATVTGAIVAPLFFALCWAGAFLPVGPGTHLYLRLFTDAPASSAAALIQGICWSLVFGAVAGFLLSIIYNGLERLDR
jgi:hypothetical protein